MCDHVMIRVDLDGAVVCEICGTRLGAPRTQVIEPWDPWTDVSHEDPEDEVW